MSYLNGFACRSSPKFASRQAFDMKAVGYRRSTEGLIGVALPENYEIFIYFSQIFDDRTFVDSNLWIGGNEE
jgi:hypothetical protein